MSTSDEPPIVFEPAPTVTALYGNESAADEATLAVMCWLLQRYSSRACLARAQALFQGVVDAFDAWPQATERCSPQTLQDWSQALRAHQAAFERGLALLERGYTAATSAAVVEAVGGLEPEDPRDDLHFSLGALLDELGPPAAVGGRRAAAMAQRIHHTLTATWACETILANRPSLRMRPLRLPDPLPRMPTPPAEAPMVKTGGKVPTTGIWMPTTLRAGCPNFLIAGSAAPAMIRACERIDYAAWPGSTLDEARPAWSDYEFIDEATVWRLLWADERYRDGHDPDDEAAFLDEENALP